MSQRNAATTPLSHVLREPTLHFALLAAVLFGASSLFGAGRGEVIEIDPAAVQLRIFQIEAGRGAPLTEEERRQVEEAWIDEQILVREARALGLEEDERIHDILAQKMLHVLSAEVIQPTETELAAYYEDNRARYTPEPTLTADELVVATDVPLPPDLRVQLREGTGPDQLVTGLTLTPRVLSGVALDDLTAIFGTETAELVFSAREREWVGPHHSVRGQHWFRVTERTPSALLPLDVVRERVRLDWIEEQEAARLERRVAELRSRYTLVRPDGENAP